MFQELAPILFQTLHPTRPARAARDGAGDPAVREALAPLSGPAPPVFIVEDDDLVIFSTTGKNASITLSSGLAASLSVDQLRAALAHEMKLALTEVYEVATFYVMFHTSKPGKYVVEVCTNLSCALWGAEDLLGYLEQKLGVKAGESNSTWTLREAECLASCGSAPFGSAERSHPRRAMRARSGYSVPGLKR